MSELVLIWKADCVLGEGPVWSAGRQKLFFVDIKGRKLLQWSETQGGEQFKLMGEIGFALQIEGTDDLLVGVGQRLGIIDLIQKCISKWLPYELNEPVRNRINDAKCDPYGRLWFASMDNRCKKKNRECVVFRSQGDFT